LLIQADYRFAYFDGLNRFYVADEKSGHLMSAFGVPPNVFDGFVLAGRLAAERTAHDALTTIADLQRKLSAALSQAQAAENQRAVIAADSARAFASMNDVLSGCERRLVDCKDSLHAALLSRDAVLRSNSWRLTAPIRGISRFLKSRSRSV
jgi:hypothetical protein